MKPFFKLFSTIAMVSVLLLSCNSNSGLKKQAEQINKLTERVEKVKDINALKDIKEEFAIFMEQMPADLMQLTEEELMKLDGGKELVEAGNDFKEAYEKATLRVLASSGVDDLDDFLDFLDDEE